MAKKPQTLPEALAALELLQNVVDRLAERVNELEDVQVPVLRQVVDEVADTTGWLVERTDEVGEAAVKAGRDLNQRFDADIPANASPAQRLSPRVTMVRIGNRTVARRA